MSEPNSTSPNTVSDSQYDYDLFVIGAGSGGVRASRVAAQLGAKVAIAEDRYLGGTCVNVGCVPKKLFVYASHFSEEFSAASGFGWQVSNAELDWPRLRDNKTQEIQRLNRIYEQLLSKAGVELLNAHATITGPHSVDVDGRTVTARNILVATGGWPFVPEFPGRDLVITSNEVFYLNELPERVVVVGGGYIAIEFAGIFHGLGVDTHLVYRGPLFLRGFDLDIRRHMVAELEKKGIHIHFNADVETVIRENQEQSLKTILSNGETLVSDQVMYATGRRPMTDNLGLQNTQVKLNDKGQIIVDKNYCSDEASIFAVGDVKGGKELTPVAIAEGAAVANSLFGALQTVDYAAIPTAVFSQPNIATVGLTEDEAQEQLKTVHIYESRFRHLKHTLSGLDETTYMKLVVDGDSDKVVGCHMVGQEAGEIIQGLAVAIKAGATKADFDRTIGIHPTAAEEFVTMRTSRDVG